MIGYKIAKAGNTIVIITLEIPEDAQTNMDRKGVSNKAFAKYRASKVKVLAIEDAKGNTYESATTCINPFKSITYKVGETIIEPRYNPDPHVVCGEGIHYFLTRQAAETYNSPQLITKDCHLTSCVICNYITMNSLYKHNKY